MITLECNYLNNRWFTLAPPGAISKCPPFMLEYWFKQKRTLVDFRCGPLGPHFAVHRLLSWYRQGANLAAKLPLLSTYLGHSTITGTEIYLQATAQLLECAGQRFHNHFAVPLRTQLIWLPVKTVAFDMSVEFVNQGLNLFKAVLRFSLQFLVLKFIRVTFVTEIRTLKNRPPVESGLFACRYFGHYFSESVLRE
jgi:hypothetical protein